MLDRIRPKALHPGATIGVVSPSYWLDNELLNTAISYLESHGYQLILGESVRSRMDIFAGSPDLRARDIMSMFANPDIDAIICARGGYGANRVLPLLDFETIRKNPKIFMGFSDVTAILNSLATEAGLVCFHGPMIGSFGKKQLTYNLTQMQQVLGGEINAHVPDLPECQARILRAGEASGILVGGNLSLINERLGTPTQIDCANKILLIEEVGEKLYAFDRMMMHLKNSGSLRQLKGLIIGEMTEMSDTDVPFGKSTDEIILDICEDIQAPIISNFPAGHGDYIATLPIGHDVTIIAKEQECQILIPQQAVTA